MLLPVFYQFHVFARKILVFIKILHKCVILNQCYVWLQRIFISFLSLAKDCIVSSSNYSFVDRINWISCTEMSVVTRPYLAERAIYNWRIYCWRKRAFHRVKISSLILALLNLAESSKSRKSPNLNAREYFQVYSILLVWSPGWIQQSDCLWVWFPGCQL